MNKPSWKQIAIVAIFINIISIWSVGYVLSQSASTFVIAGGIYPGAPNYTIWREGSNYYAKDQNGLRPSWSGGTNPTTVLNSALTSSGVSVFLAKGTYVFPAIVYYPSNVLIYGEGPSTILRGSFTSQSLFRSSGFVAGAEGTSTPQENVTFRDLRFLGAYTSGPQLAIDGARVTDVTVENVIISDFNDYGVKFWYSEGVCIDNNVVYNIPNGDGIHVVYSKCIRITNNKVYDVQDSCIGFPLNTNGSIIGNILKKTSTTMNPTLNGRGIDISGSNYTVASSNVINVPRAFTAIVVMTYLNVHCHDVIVANNIMYDSGYYAISVEGSTVGTSNQQMRISIIGNQIRNTQRIAIHILRSGFGVIAENIITDSSQEADNGYDDIILDSGEGDNNSTHWIISGNAISNNVANDSRYGIYLTGGANYCLVTNNLIIGPETAEIQDSGVGNAVHNNMLDDVWTA